MVDTFFLVIFPYISITLFCLVTTYRYINEKFSVSSISSQFLESKHLFYGTLPFHIGIILLFIGHLTLFLFPRSVLEASQNLYGLYAIEVIFLTSALLVFLGIVNLIVRRFTNAKVFRVTSVMDIIILFLLLLEIIIGIYIATFYRWGSNWFAIFISPYLTNLVTFSPSVESIKALPVMIKIHIITGFFIFAIFPFTRLIHMIVAPFHYLVRPYQRVIWNKYKS